MLSIWYFHRKICWFSNLEHFDFNLILHTGRKEGPWIFPEYDTSKSKQINLLLKWKDVPSLLPCCSCKQASKFIAYNWVNWCVCQEMQVLCGWWERAKSTEKILSLSTILCFLCYSILVILYLSFIANSLTLSAHFWWLIYHTVASL